jgi:hypothetical protein
MDRINRRSLLAIAAMVFSVPMAVGQSPQIDRPGYETLPPGQVFGIVGRNVTGSDGADAGRLWDVLIDRDGEPRAVVIDYGGVLGVGRRKIAIAWKAVSFAPDDAAHPIRLMLTRRQMGTVPSFAYGSVPVTLGYGR